MTSPITIASLTNPNGSVDMDRLAELVSVAEEMRVALHALLDDCVEYVRINRLHNADGSPATDHAMRSADAALTRATAFVASVTDEAKGGA